MLNTKEKINIDFNNKYFCYILGLIWADGYVEKNSNRVTVSIIEEDMENIKYIFKETGFWLEDYFNNEKRKFKNQLRLSISDKYFSEFLSQNDFKEKSKKSPYKVLSLISSKNIKYFLRGISDGDGCFYYNKKNYTRQYVISSTYEQEWSYISDILKLLDCKYEIRKVINKKGKSKSSLIRITNKDIIKFGDYIYDDFFGLERKFKIYKIIKNSYLENPYENRKIRSKKLIINGIEYLSMLEASKCLNINRNTLRRRLKNNYYISNYSEAIMS
jgi:hypothetical protein